MAEVYRGYLPGESSVEDIPILGPVVSALAPVERDVITPPETTYVEDMDRRYVDKVTPGEYGEPRLGTPAAIQGILDFVGFLKDDPKAAASAIGEGIASIPEEQAQGAFALMQGADYAYDPVTGETSTFDPLLLPATTAAATMTSIARVADDGSTVLGIMGGRMAKDGPSKFSEARAARRTKDEQGVFEETGAYFDDEVFPNESSAFRFEIPTVDSKLKGIEDVVRKSNDSSAGPGGRNYFYMDDGTDVTALKGDVVAVNLLPNSRVSFETQIRNAAGELEPAKYPRLSEILDFPELYKQYPQLEDVYVARLNGNAQALMMEKGIDGRPTIALRAAFSPQMLQSHLLHEVQHVVQKIEGFPRGGDAAKMSDEDYRRLAGEVEARNVEDRFLAATAFRKSGARSDTIPPIYDPSKVVPTQTRDTNPSQILLDDGNPAVQLSRLTDLNTFTKYLGGETLPNNPNRVFFPDLEFSEVTLRDSNYVDGALDIELLRAGKKGQGHGTEMMNRITQLADDTGKTFTLTPTPYGDGGLNLEELVEFYQSKGFRYIDPDPDNPDLDRPMVRYPRKAEGGVMGMVDLARNAGRGPRGVESLVPVARNMNRSMLG